jgi:hypothetical protein
MSDKTTNNEEQDFFLQNVDEPTLSIDMDDVDESNTIFDLDNQVEDLDKAVEKVIKKEPKNKKEALLDVDTKDIDPDSDDTDEEEEKPKEKDKKDKKVEDKKTTKKSKSPTLDYKSVLSALKDKGVITGELPEEINSDEDLLTVFESEFDAFKKDYDTYIDEKYNGVFKYLEAGGDFEKYKAAHEAYPYDTMKEEDILKDDKTKEQAYYDYYLSKGMDDKEIKRNMKRAKDLEEFDEDVKDVLPKLQNISKKKKEQLIQTQLQEKTKQEESMKQFRTNVVDTVNKMEEYIPGQKMTKIMRDKITQYATGNEIWEEMQKDPVKARVTLATLKALGILDGKWDKVNTDLTTKATKEVKSQFLKYKNNGADSDDNGEDSNTGDKTLKAFEKMFMRK